jgi:hypothetical protein
MGESPKLKNPARKRRTREHVIADLSVNYVERRALLCGYTVERMAHDYGIDLELFTFNRKGEIEEGTILLQLKASDRLKIRPGQATFPFRIERKDLVLWLAQTMPVILVVYDARKDVAYWLYVQSHFQLHEGFNVFTAGKSITVQVATANVLNPEAIRKLARFRDRILEQLKKVTHVEDKIDPVR